MSAKRLLLAALGLFQTLGVGQNALAHTDALRGDLKQLIVGDELECRFDGHLARRNQAQRIIRTGCTHVGQLLLLQTLQPCPRRAVLADDHAFVYHRAGADEQRAAILCVEQAIADSLAGLKRDQRTGGALLDIALVRLIAVEYGDITPSPLVSVRNSVR